MSFLNQNLNSKIVFWPTFQNFNLHRKFQKNIFQYYFHLYRIMSRILNFWYFFLSNLFFCPTSKICISRLYKIFKIFFAPERGNLNHIIIWPRTVMNYNTTKFWKAEYFFIKTCQFLKWVFDTKEKVKFQIGNFLTAKKYSTILDGSSDF